jgi:transposase-like protein
MPKVDKKALEKMEANYKGITGEIMAFEDAILPACPNCCSPNTAIVRAGVIGRSLSIAAATSKMKLILNMPGKGKYYCNDCEKYFNDESTNKE